MVHGPTDTAFYRQKGGPEATIASVSLGDRAMAWNANGRSLIEAVKITPAGHILLKTSHSVPISGGFIERKGVAVAVRKN